MHNSNFDVDSGYKSGGDVLVAIASLVTEGRIPEVFDSKTKGFHEGPHCFVTNKTDGVHKCDLTDVVCSNFEEVRDKVLDLWKKNIPVCVEVLLICSCQQDDNASLPDPYDNALILEKWFFDINQRRSAESPPFNFVQLLTAIRSQLHFSQLSAWLTVQDEDSMFKITNQNLRYLVTVPGESFESIKFSLTATKHEFPLTDIGNGYSAFVSVQSLRRMSSPPKVTCLKCSNTKESAETVPEDDISIASKQNIMQFSNELLDDRMHMSCTQKGKHRCEDFEDFDHNLTKSSNTSQAVHKKLCQTANNKNCPSCTTPATSSFMSKLKLSVDIEQANFFGKYMQKRQGAKQSQQHWLVGGHTNDLNVVEDKGKLLLDAIERSAQKSTIDKWEQRDGSDRSCDFTKCVQKRNCAPRKNEMSDIGNCDMNESDISSDKGKCKYDDESASMNNCDSIVAISRQKRNVPTTHRKSPKKRLTFDEFDEQNKRHERDGPDLNGDYEARVENNSHLLVEIPSQKEQAKFRKDLDNAASMVFHSRTGLPLTSSPAPVRRGKSCFDFDSTITSVSAIKSALYTTSFSTDEESESDGSIISPCSPSPETSAVPKRELSPVKFRRRGHAANLLGSFEESVLNGRLEPVSTVHGFTAELGASGSFVPKHLVVPVTVFFYTLGDNDKISSPYLSHINLGKKGYNVPKSGTVQVTLFNPLGTVVKMFVIMYDLSEMPPNSQTFIRQRTLNMPINCKEEEAEWSPKWLRFLIHLRFMSSKSGKIYLHSDIRIIIMRKSDLDTATAHGIDLSYELRSFTRMPSNPRFSPRK